MYKGPLHQVPSWKQQGLQGNNFMLEVQEVFPEAER